VAVAKGAPARVAGVCWTSPCAYVTVTGTGFAPDPTYTVELHDTYGTDPLPAKQVTTDSSGNFAASPWIFGYPGYQVSCSIGRYHSDALTW